MHLELDVPALEHIDTEVAFSNLFVRVGLQLGLPVEKVTRTSGMVISPRFYQSLDRAELKEISMQLDFRVNSITSLVFFGGVPPTYATRRLVVALLRKGHNVIVICGNNEGLLQDLCKLKVPAMQKNRYQYRRKRNSIGLTFLESCDCSSNILSFVFI